MRRRRLRGKTDSWSKRIVNESRCAGKCTLTPHAGTTNMSRDMFKRHLLDAPERPAVLAYGVVVLSTGAAYMSILLLQTQGQVSTCVLAVIVSTWFGGTKPGVL